MSLNTTKGETPYQFGVKFQEVTSFLLTRLRLTENGPNIRKVKTTLYDDLHLQIYLQGLPTHLSLPVSLRKPENLEIVMSIVIEEENFAYGQNKSNILSSHRTAYNQRKNSNQSINQTQINRLEHQFRPTYNFSQPNNFPRPKFFPNINPLAPQSFEQPMRTTYKTAI